MPSIYAGARGKDKKFNKTLRFIFGCKRNKIYLVAKLLVPH